MHESQKVKKILLKRLTMQPRERTGARVKRKKLIAVDQAAETFRLVFPSNLNRLDRFLFVIPHRKAKLQAGKGYFYSIV